MIRVIELNPELPAYLFFALAAPLVVGTVACSAIERHRPTYFVSALPVGEWQPVGARVRALLVVALIVGVLLARLEPARDLWRIPPSPFHVVFALGMIVVAAGAILLAYLFRFYFQSLIISILLASLPAAVWCLLIMAGMRGNRQFQPDLNEVDVVHGMFALTWPLLVAVGLPIFALWLTVCRSPLREQSESRRAAIGLLLMFLLTTWGGALISLSPADIVTILIH